jgi:hypothetical protein
MDSVRRIPTRFLTHSSVTVTEGSERARDADAIIELAG